MKEKTADIIIPTLYIGGIKPENPKYGDVFYDDCDGKFFIFLDKWFETFNVKETEYTTEQIIKIQKEKEEKQREENKELKEYREFKKILKKFINESE